MICEIYIIIIIIMISHCFECLVWCEWINEFMCINEIPVASLEGCVFYWYLSCKCNFSPLVLRERVRLCQWNIACFSSSIMGRVSPEGRSVNTLNSPRAFEDKWRKTSDFTAVGHENQITHIIPRDCFTSDSWREKPHSHMSWTRAKHHRYTYMMNRIDQSINIQLISYVLHLDLFCYLTPSGHSFDWLFPRCITAVCECLFAFSFWNYWNIKTNWRTACFLFKGALEAFYIFMSLENRAVFHGRSYFL